MKQKKDKEKKVNWNFSFSKNDSLLLDYHNKVIESHFTAVPEIEKINQKIKNNLYIESSNNPASIQSYENKLPPKIKIHLKKQIIFPCKGKDAIF